MLKPFLRALREHPDVPKRALEPLEQMAPGTRIPVAAAQQMLANTVRHTGDEDLGLKAAQASEVGDYEVVEYAAASAPTWRAALEVAFRYCRLMNEAADFRLEERDGTAYIVLQSTVPLARPAKDFQTAALFVSSARWLPAGVGQVTVWFSHPEPESLEEYRRTFGDVEVRFGQSWDGFVFDAALLDLPMPQADPSLHRVLRQHADRLLEELAPGDSLIERVRADILATLKDASVGAETTAARLHMSRRTLTRQLGQHGTSFSELLEDVRRRLAVRYLQTTDHSVEDIAFLLGYSNAAPFVRAFKRWTGKAPLEFRRSQRRL